MTTAPSDAGGIIVRAFAAADGTRLPKHVRLYDAIVGEIEAGRLPVGEKLPSERELSTAAGISLGTVQKTLGLLATDGRLVREHGRGTFVRAGRRPMTELWHYRFRDPVSGELLPAYARLFARDRVEAAAPWRDVLAPDPAGYVRIQRVVSIADRFRCWSEMFLPYGRFGALMGLPRADIESVNLKHLLADRFRAPTLSTEQTVVLRPFAAAIAERIGARRGEPGLLLSIVALSRGDVPITFQQIHIPKTDCELEMGADARASRAGLAA